MGKKRQKRLVKALFFSSIISQKFTIEKFYNSEIMREFKREKDREKHGKK